MVVDKIQKIKKRNGAIVDFDAKKIVVAMQKAFIAVRGIIAEEELLWLRDAVMGEVEARFAETVPSVEDVQDIVERKIMERGYFDVAKAYIIYRYKHTEEREAEKQDVLRKIEENELAVVKRSGARERFSFEKIKQAIARRSLDLPDVNVNAVALQCRNELYDNITTHDISRALAMTARSFIEEDPMYSQLASRLLLQVVYREAMGESFKEGNFDDAYRQAFVKTMHHSVLSGRLDRRMLEFDLEALSRDLVPGRDDLLRYLGTQTLYDRYFLRDVGGREVLETPQAFWMRIAMGLAINEKEKMEWAPRFYEVLSTFRYVPSTPTLFHAGMPKAQLASCFLYMVGDDLSDIFKSYGDIAQLLKWSGGTAMDWTPVRATGALIQSTGVESQGVIPFLKIANDTTIAINRSGRRRGANCVYLETWHYDIEDFLELRKNTGDERRRTHDMNTANWIPDLFMKRVRSDEEWTLFSPEEVPDLHDLYGRAFEERYKEYEAMAREGRIVLWRRVRARELWKKMLSMLFETGHPWVTFKDAVNIRSPQDHVGVVHNSNLCTEITLNNSAEETAVCNLGWVNFAAHITGGRFDREKVAETVRLGMRMLDNVIDANFYPTAETKTANFRHRPVGLGMGGFQDALYCMDIPFDSEAAVEFADQSMECISYHAFLASADLARERGAYETFAGSKWDRGILPCDTLQLVEQERGERIAVSRRSSFDWEKVREAIRRSGMRNSNCLAVAPTASTANIVGAFPSIEPIYKNIYVKANMSGDFTVANPYLVNDLKKMRLWSSAMLSKIKFYDGNISKIPGIPDSLKEKYKEVFQINPRWLIRIAAHRGKWIDQSQSLNIFFAGASGKQLSDIYQYAWEMGLKTTYYLRTLAASQVEKATVNTSEFGATHRRSRMEEVPLEAASYEPVPVIEMPQETVQPVAAVEEFTEGVLKASVAIAEKTLPLLCKIDDPSCESCQ